MTPPRPGEFVRVEVVEDSGLTVEKAAEILGVSERQLLDLLNGDAELTPQMAQRFEKAFGVGGDMLLQMQKWHNTSRTCERSGKVAVQS
ncbi:MAG: HigA family addiction module antitoxin [Dehalococcoidia bacterium]|nr:HigA family addiction module antitoxin [Dehalococcoidia bacterium]